MAENHYICCRKKNINLQNNSNMTKRLLLMLMASLLLFPALAQGDGNNAIFTKPKFSGFAMASYQATFQDAGNSNSFDLRLVRASIEGRILNDFYYKIQGQINGNTTTLGSRLHGMAKAGLLPCEIRSVQAPVYL